MSKSSSPKGKARDKTKPIKPSKSEAGDTRNSRSLMKSNDPKKLEKYLELLLPDTTQRGKKGKRPQRPNTQDRALQIKNDISSFVKDVISFCTSELPGKKKMEYLLNAVRDRRVLAYDLNDSLVDKARDKLPSLAYKQLASCLVQEAKQTIQKSIPCVTFTFGEGLLSHFCHLNDEWKVFLAECKPKELPSIFKHLISIGVQKFISKATDVHAKEYFHPAPKFILVSEHSVDGLALMLKEEVKQGKDQPASFFTSTQFGSLLSLNIGNHTNENMRFNSLEGFLLDALSDKTRTEDPSDIIKTVRLHVVKMIEVVTTAVTNMLQSSIELNRQSVLAWMAAVINSIINSRFQEPPDRRSHDVYLITFSAVLLSSWKLFRGEQIKSTDFSHYSSDECNLSLEGEISLTGDEIKVVNKSSCSSMTRVQAAEKLFFCCQRALGVCLLPALYRELDIPNSAELRYNLQIHLTDKTLFHECLHQMVAYVCDDQCELLVQKLRGNESLEGRNATELQTNILSVIPHFLIENMSNWIVFIFKGQRAVGFQSIPLENCSELCIHLLEWRHYQVISYGIAFASIATLRVLADFEHKEKCILAKMDAEINQVLPSLLSFYAREHGAEISHRRVVSDTKAYIVRHLHKCWPMLQFQKTLHEIIKTELFREYLISFLDELQILIIHCVSVVQIHQEKAADVKGYELKWPNDHLHFLCKLTNDILINPILWAPPLYSRTDSTVISTTRALCCLTETYWCFGSEHFELTNQLKAFLGELCSLFSAMPRDPKVLKQHLWICRGDILT